MSLRGSYKNDTEISYKLDTDLDNALQNGITMDEIGSAETLVQEKQGRNDLMVVLLGYKISSQPFRLILNIPILGSNPIISPLAPTTIFGLILE